MKKRILLFLIVFISGIKAFSQNVNKLEITPLMGEFYIYTTYNYYEREQIPAHGMYLVTHDGIILFDTPWDTTRFQPLLDSLLIRHNKPIIICIATHWHSDRTAGLEYYRSKGIKTYTTVHTDQLSIINKGKRAEFLIKSDTVFKIGEYSFETFYPGPGHTEDNIVIWFNKEKILYGGCLIKGAEADNLGFLGDGNKNAYASTLKNVQKKYPAPEFIIISHHDWKDNNSLKNSLRLANKFIDGK